MTVTEDDIKRVVRGPAEFLLKKQVSFLQDKCRQAGTIIRDLELQKSSLSKEFDRLSEENDNLRIMMKSKKNGAEK